MRARPRPVLLALALLALCISVAVPGARADGDPASDTLLIQQLYTPVSQKISPPVLQHLQATITAANTAGFKVRVALILDRTDLGAVPQLFGHPEQYVHLLAGELYFGWKGAIVAVQPSGIGVRNIKPLAPAQKLVDEIVLAKPATANSLAEAATTAVAKLAASQGDTLKVSGTAAASSGSGSGSSTPLVVGIVVGVLVVVLVVGGFFWRRRRPRSAGV